jgi:hypothetical protein
MEMHNMNISQQSFIARAKRTLIGIKNEQTLEYKTKQGVIAYVAHK